MTDHIELRLQYHRNVYVARICGRHERYRFEQDFHCALRKREIADFNGGWIKWRVVYLLPLVAAVYEVRDEQNRRYYVGTRPGDSALYAVELSRIEALIDRDPDIDQVIGPKIDHFKHFCDEKQTEENYDYGRSQTRKIRTPEEGGHEEKKVPADCDHGVATL